MRQGQLYSHLGGKDVRRESWGTLIVIEKLVSKKDKKSAKLAINEWVCIQGLESHSGRKVKEAFWILSSCLEVNHHGRAKDNGEPPPPQSL